jgi:hypothetical protein
VPNSDVSVVASPSAEALTYTFTLRDGVKLAAGKYEFAAQFTHKSGREATGDSFVVQAATANATAERTGAFS